MILKEYLNIYGIEETWKSLIYNLSKNSDIPHNNNIKENLLENKTFYEIADLYEFSLSYVNKLNKKKNGQYYTPEDVSKKMAEEASKFNNGIWCDPCCGIGNLSYELLKLKPELLNTMQFFDIDSTALFICRFLLSYFFNVDFNSLKNNFHNESFLIEHNIQYDFVIMNPPYNGKEKKEDIYISFMKKATESKGFVSITPQGFTNSCEKNCVELKNKINNFNYYKIFCFDNIPGCIFCGKKWGVFNTNNSNSVRAAITVCHNNGNGHFITPLFRWKTEERKEMFQKLDSFLEKSDNIYYNKKFLKLFKATENFIKEGNKTVKELLSKNKTQYVLYVPSTPRYYITASKTKLNRSSYHKLYFNNTDDLNKCYLVINSSKMYWWWRVADGGMTLSLDVLKSIRFDYNKSINSNLINKLENEEITNKVQKLNSGKITENIKHSEELIKEIDCFLGYDSLFFTRNNSYV